ncbi:MAG: quinone-dependent dihydroorotate dehydrogenase [Pseudanabaenaceae cyanobacterium bins.68]|nr:quinone-dependent dihydroorotate dehydrogenase [Pseudanabaenaceae cyanobacterium bins.68]
MLAQVYQQILRPGLFQLEPEVAHGLAIAVCTQISRRASWQKLVSQVCQYQHPALSQNLWGLEFPNPLGLAAGFDKGAIAPFAWQSLGFGFGEVGSITAHAQPGNPPPRLFRLPRDRALLNHLGFNNPGAAAVAEALSRLDLAQNLTIPLGINLGKSKITPLAQAAEDYCHSFQLLAPFAGYFVINVSSPNTPGLRDLQAIAHLEQILTQIQALNSTQIPILVKVAPDLDDQDLQAIALLAMGLNISGIIATNTTISRQNLIDQTYAQAPGGISGQPLAARSTEVIRVIWQASQGQLPIIGVGGICSPEDAWQKITAGASLLQIYTGWVYEGPFVIKQILQGLVKKLEQQGLNHIQAAIGLDQIKR